MKKIGLSIICTLLVCIIFVGSSFALSTGKSEVVTNNFVAVVETETEKETEQETEQETERETEQETEQETVQETEKATKQETEAETETETATEIVSEAETAAETEMEEKAETTETDAVVESETLSPTGDDNNLFIWTFSACIFIVIMFVVCFIHFVKKKNSKEQ